MAMMYYIPPLSPVVSVIENELFKLDVDPADRDFALFDHLDDARLPVQYLANLFAAGSQAPVRYALRKLLAVRTYMRRKTVDGAGAAGAIDERTLALLAEAGTSVAEVEAIYRLTTLPTLAERFVIPQYHREMAIEAWADPLARKGDAGFGYVQAPQRGD
jgi:nitrate reductase beta subunit